MRLGWIVVAVTLVGCPGEAPVIHDQGQAKQDRMVNLMDSASKEMGVGKKDHGKPTKDHGTKDTGWQTPDLLPPHDTKPPPAPDVQPWSHDIGKSCNSNSDCVHKLCATNTHTGVKFCTKVCDPCNPTCPSGTGCQNAGLAYICAPGYPNAPCPP